MFETLLLGLGVVALLGTVAGVGLIAYGGSQNTDAVVAPETRSD